MSVYQLPSGSWRADINPSGWLRYRPTLKTEAEARAHELASLARHAAGLPYEPPAGPDRPQDRPTPKDGRLLDVIEHTYTVHWKGSKSDSRDDEPWHMHSQYRNLHTFAEWVVTKDVAEALTYAKVSEFVTFLRDERKIKPPTIRKYLRAVGMAMREAVHLKYLPTTFELPKLKPYVGEPRKAFEDAEEEAILAETLRMGHFDYHDLFVVLAETGIRPPHEARSLLWRDIAPTRLTVYNSKTEAKTAKYRKLPLFRRGREAFDRLRQRHGSEPGPFCWLTPAGLDKMWGGQESSGNWTGLRRRLPWLQGRSTVPYSFRHTRATRWANDRTLAMRGITEVQVAQWLGHSMETHQTYVHPREQADDYAGLVQAVYDAAKAA